MGTQPVVQMGQPQNLRHLLYMYGAVTQVELNGFLDVNAMDDETRKQKIKAEWRTAAQAFQEITVTEAGEADTIATRPLPAESTPRAEALRADPVFFGTFPNYPITFEEVELNKLVCCQRNVHVEYVDLLRRRFQNSTRDLFDFCLTPGQDSTPVVVGRTAPNAFTASSENPSLRFLGAYEQTYTAGLLGPRSPSGQAVHAVILVLGFGASTANALRVGRRLILNNGFHRLYALRSLGITDVPLVVQHITRHEVELPPMLNELPREYLVNNPRPALLRDFFNEQLTCVVTQRSFLKAIQVGWGTNESLVPR